jgi:hypothetical protein
MSGEKYVGNKPNKLSFNVGTAGEFKSHYGEEDSQ